MPLRCLIHSLTIYPDRHFYKSRHITSVYHGHAPKRLKKSVLLLFMGGIKPPLLFAGHRDSWGHFWRRLVSEFLEEPVKAAAADRPLRCRTGAVKKQRRSGPQVCPPRLPIASHRGLCFIHEPTAVLRRSEIHSEERRRSRGATVFGSFAETQRGQRGREGRVRS